MNDTHDILNTFNTLYGYFKQMDAIYAEEGKEVITEENLNEVVGLVSDFESGMLEAGDNFLKELEAERANLKNESNNASTRKNEKSHIDTNLANIEDFIMNHKTIYNRIKDDLEKFHNKANANANAAVNANAANAKAAANSTFGGRRRRRHVRKTHRRRHGKRHNCVLFCFLK